MFLLLLRYWGGWDSSAVKEIRVGETLFSRARLQRWSKEGKTVHVMQSRLPVGSSTSQSVPSKTVDTIRKKKNGITRQSGITPGKSDVSKLRSNNNNKKKKNQMNPKIYYLKNEKHV